MKTLPRRKERTIETSREMELLLERMPVGRLAVTTEDGPYVVAVNYLFLEGNIYFHSGQVGRKMDALRADSQSLSRVTRTTSVREAHEAFAERTRNWVLLPV